MSQVTTHILDTSVGKPAVGVVVSIHQKIKENWQQLATGVTNTDGRIPDLLKTDAILDKGIYKLVFETKSYYSKNNIKTFYPGVTIEFEITDSSHYHVPLLLNPFGYSTYRGS